MEIETMPTSANETIGENYKEKYLKGFELLDSFSEDSELPEEVSSQIDSMRSSLEQGDPQPLINHVAKMIENNMSFIKGDVEELESDKDTNRFEITRNLLDALEQLKQEN